MTQPSDPDQRPDPLPRRIDNLQRRGPDTAPRRRDADPTPRRRKEDSKKANSLFGALLTAAFACFFLAYIFNFKSFATTADHVFSGLDAVGKSHTPDVVALTATVLPLLGLVIGALILGALARWVIRGAKRSRKSVRLAGRQVITPEHFREIAAARGIQPLIATHTYSLLLPHYNRSMRVRLDDTLGGDLQLTRSQIATLSANLHRDTDRRPHVGEAHDVDTVIELMTSVQLAPRNHLHASRTSEPADALRQ